MLAKHELSGHRPLARSSRSGLSARSQSRSRSETPDPPNQSARGLGVADVVRLTVVGADKEEQAEGKRETAMGEAKAGTHEVVRGRTKTRRDRPITIGNEDTTKRCPS